MKSNGGVLSADEVVHQPITTVLSGPAAGALGAALVTREAGFDRVLTLDGGGTSTDVSVVLHGEPTLTTEGTRRRVPVEDPDDRHRHGRRRRRVGGLAQPGGHAQGRVHARPAPTPGPLCYGRGGTEPTVTDAHLVLGRIPPHLLGGEVPLDVAAARDGLAALGATLGLDVPATAVGILEISAWNQANALRQITVQRGLDVRDFALTTFGGSGSLLAVPAHRHRRGAGRGGAPRPGQPLRVRSAHRRRAGRPRADPRGPARAASTPSTVAGQLRGAARPGRARR